jgi:hypothetical protein
MSHRENILGVVFEARVVRRGVEDGFIGAGKEGVGGDSELVGAPLLVLVQDVGEGQVAAG